MKLTTIMMAWLFLSSCASVENAPTNPIPTQRPDPGAAQERLQAESDEPSAVAEQGDIEAQLSLADQGNAAAQYQLGTLFQKGLGVLKDEATAAKWFQMAAEQGHSMAQLRLGVLYANGNGVPQNFIRGHAWFNVASANGAEGGAEKRDSLAKDMSSSQIAEAQALAREYFDKYKAK